SARSWDPAPSTSDRKPTTIMERCVAPGSVVNPGISPRINPGPVPVVIGSPTAGYSGKPDVSIGRVWAPITVIIKVGNSDEILRAIARRTRTFVAAVTLFAPVIEIVGIANLLYFRVQGVSSIEGHALAGIHGIALSVAG